MGIVRNAGAGGCLFFVLVTSSGCASSTEKAPARSDLDSDATTTRTTTTGGALSLTDAARMHARAIPRSADVFVYDGPHAGHPGTTCRECADTVVRRVKALGYTVERVYADQITTAILGQTRLFVWPGGNDDSDATFDEFRAASAPHHDNVAELRQWVNEGAGRYLGLCMGAYLAGHTPEGRVFDMLNGADAEAEAGDADFASHAVVVRLTSAPAKTRTAYYQAGPYFTEASDQEVWARYETTKRIAAMIVRSGQGTVGVVGAHFEATKDWYGDCVPKTDAAGSAEWAACASLRSATDANHAFLGAFIARVLDR